MRWEGVEGRCCRGQGEGVRLTYVYICIRIYIYTINVLVCDFSWRSDAILTYLTLRHRTVLELTINTMLFLWENDENTSLKGLNCIVIDTITQ